MMHVLIVEQEGEEEGEKEEARRIGTCFFGGGEASALREEEAGPFLRSSSACSSCT